MPNSRPVKTDTTAANSKHAAHPSSTLISRGTRTGGIIRASPSSSRSRRRCRARRRTPRAATFSVRNWRIRSPAPRAERGAHHDFTLARHAASQRQVGEVGAADEQHEPGRRHQHQERGAHVLRPDQRVGVALDDDAPALVRGREVRSRCAAPITSMLACACSSVTPSFSRANEVSQWKSRVMFDGSNASGRQIWAAARSKALPSGRTPTMVWGWLSRSTVAVDDRPGRSRTGSPRARG